MFVDMQPADYQPELPSDLRHGIGIVGCGILVSGLQMPAYKKAGYRVVACCDKIEERARSVAANFGSPLVTTNLEELLSHPEVRIVDLAVHAHQRLPLVEQIAAAGKHIFSQKPLAPSLREAEQIVEICRNAGVTLMVNHQARWAPPHRALRLLVERGVLGHVYAFTHLHRAYQDYGWYAEREDFNIVSAPALHDQMWFLDGTRGSALLSNPAGTAKLSLSLKDSPEQVQTFEIAGTWEYEGFAGSMGEMLLAVEEGREPESSGRDHLESLRMAFAAVESANSGDSVELSH